MTLARLWRRGDPGGGDSAIGPALRAACAALPLLLGACTAIPDWADPSRWGSTDTAAAKDAPAPDDSFPNLANVPDAAPKPMAPEMQAQIKETLAADRANAEYTGQSLKADMGANAAKMPTADAGKLLPTQVAAPTAEPPASPAADVEPADVEPADAESADGEPADGEATTQPPTQSAFRFPQFEQGAAATAPAHSELIGVIYFGYGSTALNANDREVLRDVVALQQQRGGTIRVIGHASARTAIADPVRHRFANFETSLKRANAVAAELVILGATRDKVAAEARGDAQPVYHEFMLTGEAGNQRAEIFLEN